MNRLALCVARHSASAWVGAALLFVAVAVRQVTSRKFSREVIDQLALLRFPLYYQFGFIFVGMAILGTLLAGTELPRLRRFIVLALLVLGLLVMIADYRLIYRPLAEMVTPPGKPRDNSFSAYHQASEMVNVVQIQLVMVAAILLNWPAARMLDADAKR